MLQRLLRSDRVFQRELRHVGVCVSAVDDADVVAGGLRYARHIYDERIVREIEVE